MCVCVYVCVCMYGNIHKYVHIYIQSNKYILNVLYTPTHTPTHIYIYILRHTHIYTHKNTHTHTHTHTHTRTHIYIYIYIYAVFSFSTYIFSKDRHFESIDFIFALLKFLLSRSIFEENMVPSTFIPSKYQNILTKTEKNYRFSRDTRNVSLI